MAGTEFNLTRLSRPVARDCGPESKCRYEWANTGGGGVDWTGYEEQELGDGGDIVCGGST